MSRQAACLVCTEMIDAGGPRVIITTALSGKGRAEAEPLRIGSAHEKCWDEVHTAILRLRKEKEKK